MKKWLVPAIVLGLILGVWYLSTLKTPSPTPVAQAKADLRTQLEKTEKEIDHTVRRYSVKKFDKIDDLTISVEPILKGLPGVENVIVKRPEKPTRRIIHILDWHYVDKVD